MAYSFPADVRMKMVGITTAVIADVSSTAVNLTDLIAEAGLRNDAAGDFKRMVFVAAAKDGYAVTFSWHELFNTPVGENALIVYECDGEPLSAEDGAPVLFSGADIMAAPRHVKRLARIDVQVLRPL